ncbi:MAG TPA: GNAT family N-acetyltransferase [Actinomycetota bacterium]
MLALDPSRQIFGVGKVHPGHAEAGLGAALLDMTERMATSRLPVDVTAPFRTAAPATDVQAAELFAGRGYHPVRSFWNMQRPLPADEAAAPAPPEVTLRLGAAADEQLAYRILDDAFGDHFGYEPMTFEGWQHELHGDPGYDPTLMVMAFVAGEPAGVSVNFRADDGAGWVGELGVLSAFRRRGVARALLARSFAELEARGHHEVRLGVDTENASGATHLYESVGMTVRRRYDVYEKRVTGA